MSQFRNACRRWSASPKFKFLAHAQLHKIQTLSPAARTMNQQLPRKKTTQVR
jgi:hypothetical protein